MLSHFLLILLFSSSSLLVGGLIIYLCYRLFCFLVGTDRGRPVLFFVHACFTPLRGLSQLISSVLFLHRVTGFRLLSLKDPEGELGYVEHDFNPKNPVALLGDYVFFLAPVLTGLAAVHLIMRLCFGELFPPLLEKLSALGDTPDIALTFAAAGAFFTSVFADILHGGLMLKLLGLLILSLLCLGFYLDPADLLRAFRGFIAFAVTVLLFAGLCTLFDPRLVRIMLTALNVFWSFSIALLLPTLAAAVIMVAFGGILFLCHRLADWAYERRHTVFAEEDEESAVEESEPLDAEDPI